MSKLYPLTRQQQGLWVEWKRNKDDISYNTCVQVEMEGEIDVEKFINAANSAVGHFDMLRAYLVEKDLKPYLTFGEQPYNLPFTDFSNGGVETTQLRQKAIDFLDKIRLEPIPLDQFPLVNAHLVKTAKNKFYFIGVVPHMISDGVSAVMFLQSLSTCYNLGEEALKEQFSYVDSSWVDYLSLCDEKLPQDKMDQAYEYWQNNLAFSSHIVDIGARVCERKSNVGLRFQFDSTLEVFRSLRKISRANKTGLFSAISASLAAFISRYYDPEELIIGYPVNLRPGGYKNAFGFYVNVLPLKLTLDEGDSFNDLVQKAHIQRKLDKNFQYLPSIDIVRSKRKTDPNFNGQMFNISMAQTVSRLQNLELDNIKSRSLDNKTIEIKDDLSLIYEVSEDGISFWFEYLAELFSEHKIAAMSRHFLALLEEMTQNPDKKIAHIDILDDDEKNHIISQKSSAKLQPNNIIGAFKDSVLRNPQATALIFNDKKLSYQELDEKSSALAKYLSNNIDPTEDLIALALPYGEQRIIAMLSVLKSGFAYIPIETDTPLERINAIIDDSGAKHLMSLQPFNVAINNIILGELTLEGGDFVAKNNDLAYVIYTSGSTGKPKGVVVTQDKVVSKMQWMQKEFRLQVSDKILQSTSYSFDVSVAEIFWPLFSGATLVILDEEQRKDFRYQGRLIQQENIVGACMVPSAIIALLKGLDDGTKLPFKFLLSAGEAMNKELVERYYKYGVDGSLYNIYGPTEAVIYAAFKQIAKDDVITIGKAVDRTQLYVLNSALQMQPCGSVGELCIGGDDLALGYLNNESLSKEKFVDNPYGPGKLYRSGDLVRMDENLEIHYLRRIDSQVKIRGYRIEIGEIESKLLEIPQIEDVVVFVNDKSQLVGAVKVVGDILDDEIKTYLSQYLPHYMVVQFIVRLDEIPTLSSGKINKKLIAALCEEKIGDVVNNVELVKPDGEKEKIMAQIWSDILRVGIEKIGTNVSFFELGGDSLMVIELECLAQKHGIYLDTKSIFKDPTILGILRSASDAPLHHFAQEFEEGEVGLLPRQVKFFEDGFTRKQQWSRCVLVESKRAINVELFKESLKEVMDHHDALRVSFAQRDSKWVAYNHLEVEPVVNEYDLSRENKRDYDVLARNIFNNELNNFELEKAPLIKVVYVKFKKHYQLALMIHHLLLDMRSCRIILEDLMMNFMAKLNGDVFDFGYKTSSVSSYLKALEDHLDHGDFEDEITYWQSELEPCQIECDEITESDMSEYNLSFTKKETQELFAIATQYDVTLHEILLAKISQNYCRVFAQKEVVFNSCFHGRDDFLDNVKISKSVGWFNTVFPVKFSAQNGDIFSYIKEKFKNIPSRSLNYLPLRFLKKDNRLTELLEPKMFFNYVSKIDTELPGELSKKLPLKIIKNNDLETISKDEKSCYEFYAEAAIVNEKLEIKIGYLTSKYNKQTISQIVKIL